MKTIYIRIIAILLCVVTVFGLVALFLRRKDEEGAHMTTQIGNSNKSKIKADTIMIEMNEGFSATADEYFYHALGLRNEYIQQYGAEIFDYYPELVENILHEADSILIDNAAYMLWGSEVGFELTEEDLAAFEEQVEDLKAFLLESGSTFTKHLKENNLTEELFRDVYLKNMYVNKLLQEYILVEEMPKIEVGEAEIEACVLEYGVLAAKHILIGEELAEDYEGLLAIAEEVLARIDEGEDFDSLMVEYSTDPGLESNPNGYTFRKGEFIPEFEAVTSELEIGEISGVVESDYGIHIIMRIDIDEETVKLWVRQEKMEQKRLSYEQRLNPITTEARNNLILLDMNPII